MTRKYQIVSRAPTRIDKLVAARIRALRADAGMTQLAVAQVCGISCQEYQHQEYARHRITIGRLFKIAEALGVPVTEILWGIE